MDGEHKGTTPLVLSLRSDISHEIHFQKEGFKSSSDLFNPTYQYILGVEYIVNDYISIYSEVKNTYVKSVHLARGSSKETYGSMEMNPMSTLIGLKFSF